ncbi:MAG: AmmeMemoRadiSam system radical SAM enzyme [Candidatus Omnitrophica bacterium]|nr:AmmeMemoRadiSam system radical SAM enzyme [Candidatus Omnitrophota bacterium]
MTRKEFLKRACALCLGVGATGLAAEWLGGSKAFAAKTTATDLHEAMYYKRIDDETVQCQLCPRFCTLSNGQRSFCRVREPRNGKLYSFVYGLVCAAHIDPIEKKPLFHFLPGTRAFSIATAGCNYRCKSCQNWAISQLPPEQVYNDKMSPEEIVNRTFQAGCPTIAYTYTEPVIFYEYMLDTSKIAKAKGLRNMCHSNGSFNQEALEELSLYLDAANIDLKGFSQSFYTDFAAGYLDRTLETIKTLKKNKVWVEITNLIVPTLNDDMAKVSQMCEWVYQNVGPDVPLHFSRFWPEYKLTNLYPTAAETLKEARDIAVASGMRYVYIGNIPGIDAESTHCHNCKKVVIRRSGYTILEDHVKDGKCEWCKTAIPGVWN